MLVSQCYFTVVTNNMHPANNFFFVFFRKVSLFETEFDLTEFIHGTCRCLLKVIERLRSTFTANSRNGHVTMFSTFAARCFQFLNKIEQFCVGFKSQNYFALFSSLSSFFQENINANLTFAANAILNLILIAKKGGAVTFVLFQRPILPFTCKPAMLNIILRTVVCELFVISINSVFLLRL